MIGSKKILAVIPARGGSKGVKLKNLRDVGGNSLLAHAILTCQEIKEIDRIIISTDHDLIAQKAEELGVQVPFRRPESLSGDRIGDLDVLTHAIISSQDYFNETYDIILMIQPTSPLRNSEDIRKCISMLVEKNLDSVWTVSETDLKYHPIKQLVLDDNGLMNYFDPRGATIIARQQLTPVYHRNGCCYSFTKECLLNQKKIMGNKTSIVVIDRPMISIDTEEDIQKVDLLMRKL